MDIAKHAYIILKSALQILLNIKVKNNSLWNGSPYTYKLRNLFQKERIKHG